MISTTAFMAHVRSRIASTSSAVGSDGCAPNRDAASAPAAQARRRASSRLAALEQRDQQTGGERVAGRGAVDDLHWRRRRARDLLPVLQQHGALGAERERDEPVAPRERLELVAVDDGEVGVHGERSRGRGVQAEEPRRTAPRPRSTASSGISSWQSTASSSASSNPARQPVRAGRDDDLVLAGRVDEDHRDAGRRFRLAASSSSTPASRSPASASSANGSAHGRDERHLRAEARARDGLVRALAAGHALERRAGDRLAGPRQPLAARDEVEVDRADDGDAGGMRTYEGDPSRSRPLARPRPTRLCAQIVDGRAEQRVSQVEQAGPERRAVRARLRGAPRR